MAEYIEKERAIELIQKNATREKFEGSRAKAKGMLLAKYIVESIPAADVRENVPPQTKGDEIRAMSDEELAVFLETAHYDGTDYDCGQYQYPNGVCAWLDWLKSPAEGEA